MRLCLVHEDVDVCVRLYSVVYDNMGTREEFNNLCGYSLQGDMRRQTINDLWCMIQSCEPLNVEIVSTCGECGMLYGITARWNVLY